MPSRKTLLLGAGALVLIVIAVVLLRGGGGPSPTVERGDGSQFPLRGSLAENQGAIDDAIAAWEDDGHVSDADVHVLYAGAIEDRSVVVIRQADRVSTIQQLDDAWSVGATTRGFDPFDGSPLDLNDLILLPAGDWTWLPLVHDPSPPRTLDGLVDGGAELEPGFAVEKGGAGDLGSLYDVDAGLFRIDGGNYDKVLAASQHPGGLLAIHAALTGEDEKLLPNADVRTFDVLWTGKVPGAPQAAVVARENPERLGLGLVDDPTDSSFGAGSLSLGSDTGPLGARRRDDFKTPQVGATYVVDEDNRPQTLVAAAAGPVDHLEFLVGARRFTRPGPIAIVPVDWDTSTTDAVVVGRSRSGDVIAPLVPLSR
jgi:hypothetical protein